MEDDNIVPFLRPAPTICARCDEPLDAPGWACCRLCADAASRAVARAGPGALVTFAMVEAERRRSE